MGPLLKGKGDAGNNHARVAWTRAAEHIVSAVTVIINTLDKRKYLPMACLELYGWTPEKERGQLSQS
jgi:hypothetical protein